MREFYFEDKEKSIIFTGMQPKDDINCDPYDYFMYLYAAATANLLIQIARKDGKSNSIVEALIRNECLAEVKKKMKKY